MQLVSLTSGLENAAAIISPRIRYKRCFEGGNPLEARAALNFEGARSAMDNKSFIGRHRSLKPPDPEQLWCKT